MSVLLLDFVKSVGRHKKIVSRPRQMLQLCQRVKRGPPAIRQTRIKESSSIDRIYGKYGSQEEEDDDGILFDEQSSCHSGFVRCNLSSERCMLHVQTPQSRRPGSSHFPRSKASGSLSYLAKGFRDFSSTI